MSCETEIANFDPPVRLRVEQNVGWFEVSVEDAALVHVPQSSNQVCCDSSDLREWQAGALALLISHQRHQH